ncbi:hypothetical protein [Eilatimonas milleporae]|uniref:hypothetical protein n=1 Tax=Eilatimonas milleporae TaxID=911205 RepID=UPI000EF9F4AF|nr:hypothetical protein [Eilatimonas milleporae]
MTLASLKCLLDERGGGVLKALSPIHRGLPPLRFGPFRARPAPAPQRPEPVTGPAKGMGL